jgi:uncharacterized protein YjiS (DUF1127 family)
MKTFQNQNQINQPKTGRYSTIIVLAIVKTISTWKTWKLHPPTSLTQGQLNHHQLSDIGLSQTQVGLEYPSRDWEE